MIIDNIRPGNGRGINETQPNSVMKYLRDVSTIVEMKVMFMVRGWYWYVLRPLVFPLGVLFWLKVMIPDDLDSNIRIMAGAIVFGISLSTANMLSQQILQDRFLGRLKLLVTMPISKSAIFSIFDLKWAGNGVFGLEIGGNESYGNDRHV